MAGFFLKSIKYEANKAIAKRKLEEGGEVQKYIDSEVLRLCDPLVPFRTGTLKKSGPLNTKLGSGLVKYSTPYARAMYYKPANFNGAPDRGNYWFERMKNNGGKEQILQGAAKLSGGKK